MSPDQAPAASLEDQQKVLANQIEEADASYDSAKAQELRGKLAALEAGMASQGQSVAAVLEEGDPAKVEALDEKYAVAAPISAPAAPQERDEWGNLPEPPELAGMRTTLHDAQARLTSLPSGPEKEALQQEIYAMADKIKVVAEKPQMDEFIKTAEAFKEKIQDTSFETLKDSLKGYKIKNGFDDGRGHSGEGAAGYGMAIMESDMTDAQKLELLQDVYSGMSGFSGNFASEIVKGYKDTLEKKLAQPIVLAELISLGKDVAYTGILNPASLAAIQAKLGTVDGAALAEEYFAKTIGTNISDNKTAYPVYQALKGTAFASKFAELEDTRLKAAGYAGGFTL